jgi:acetyl esterase/lipase
MGALNLKLFGLGCMAIWVGSLTAAIPKPDMLWPGKAPGAKTTQTANDSANLWSYPAAASNNTGAAVVICPGGGYGHLSLDKEGHGIAAWVNKFGVSAFVLRYRLSAGGYYHPIPMWDAQRAMRWVRAHAKQYGIDTSRVGIIGFSAGGHLASTIATHYDSGKPQDADSVERYSCRPSFQILAYPVITMDASFTHMGSRESLIGKTPSQALVDSLSNEKQVTTNTPAAFLIHAKDDATVPIKNSEEYVKACKAKGVSAELHPYDKGGHGFGLADGEYGSTYDKDLVTWSGFAETWLKKGGYLEKATGIVSSRVNGKSAKKNAQGKVDQNVIDASGLPYSVDGASRKQDGRD